MKAQLLLKQRLILSETSFAEMVIWQLPAPLQGSAHHFKYRLAYVVNNACVIRYDIEAGKGSHVRIDAQEVEYNFVSTEQLIDDFLRKLKSWSRNHENRHVVSRINELRCNARKTSA